MFQSAQSSVCRESKPFEETFWRLHEWNDWQASSVPLLSPRLFRAVQRWKTFHLCTRRRWWWNSNTLLILRPIVGNTKEYCLFWKWISGCSKFIIGYLQGFEFDTLPCVQKASDPGRIWQHFQSCQHFFSRQSSQDPRSLWRPPTHRHAGLFELMLKDKSKFLNMKIFGNMKADACPLTLITTTGLQVSTDVTRSPKQG